MKNLIGMPKINPDNYASIVKEEITIPVYDGKGTTLTFKPGDEWFFPNLNPKTVVITYNNYNYVIDRLDAIKLLEASGSGIH